MSIFKMCIHTHTCTIRGSINNSEIVCDAHIQTNKHRQRTKESEMERAIKINDTDESTN